MQKFVFILTLALVCPITMGAQTFLDRLQKQQKNQGKVTVTQSAAIDDLVNGPAVQTAPAASTVQKPAVKTPVATATKPETAAKEKETKTAPKQETPKKSEEKTTPATEANETTTVDTRQKVMGKSYKVNGYRVQVFAGGNTRTDRQKAEQARTIIKNNFPTEPVYVHFYSPRWICRVGNYRTYEEAHQMLTKVRDLGYKSATVVKGKISVQY